MARERWYSPANLLEGSDEVSFNQVLPILCVWPVSLSCGLYGVFWKIGENILPGVAKMEIRYEK